MRSIVFLAVLGLAFAGCRSNGWFGGGDDSDSDTGTSGQQQGQRNLSSEDREFVQQAAAGGIFEVESSRLAVSRSRHENVRDFANMMIADHGMVNRELDTLLAQTDISMPRTLDFAHQRQLDDLRTLQGEEFDRRFYELQVAAHDEAIDVFDRASRECDDQSLRSFAAKTLPSLRKHRAELADMEEFLGVNN